MSAARPEALTARAAACSSTPCQWPRCGCAKTPVEALAAEFDGAADAFDADVRRDGLDLDIGCRDTLRDVATRVRERLAPAWDELTAKRDMLAAELQGVHAELRACGVKGDPENHWAPLMISMLARDRRAVAAERDRFRAALEDARQVLQSVALGARAPHVTSVAADKCAVRIREALEASDGQS